MKAVEIESYVKKDLSTFLKTYNFKYEKQTSSFISYVEDGFIEVVYPLIKYHPLYKLTFVFSIRLDKVEDIYSKFSTILSPFQKYSSTIMIPYDFFKDKKNFDYHFYNENELSIVLKDFKELFVGLIWPFLQQSTDIKTLYQWIESRKIDVIDSTMAPDNLIHWMIVRRLVNRVSSKELRDQLDEYLGRTEVDEDKKRINEFFEYLDKPDID